MAASEAERLGGGLIVCGVVSGIVIIVGLFAIFKGKSWLGRLRPLSAVPYGLMSGYATNLFVSIESKRRVDSYHPYLKLRSTYGPLGIAGIIATICTVAVGVAMKTMMKNKKTPVGRRRTSEYFYILIADIMFLACVMSGLSLSATFSPWTGAGCKKLDHRQKMLVGGIQRAKGENPDTACWRGIVIQYMALLVAMQMMIHIILVLPLVNLPTFLRFAIHLVLPGPRWHRLHKGADVELRSVMSGKMSQEDLIRLLPAHPHYANAIMTLSEAKVGDISEHIEFLAERCCTSDEKRSCWACADVICQACQVTRFNVKVPRTTHHIKKCYATCSGCYLLRGPAQSAGIMAMIKPKDLSVQHAMCILWQDTILSEAQVCARCAKLELDEIRAVRERREEALLQISLRRRVFCAKCRKSLPRNKRRFWICPDGDHDCQWLGHKLRRS